MGKISQGKLISRKMGKQVKTTARKGKERQKKEVKENKYKEEQGEMKTKKYRTVIIVLA